MRVLQYLVWFFVVLPYCGLYRLFKGKWPPNN